MAILVGSSGLDPGTLGLKVKREPSSGCCRFQASSPCQVTFPAGSTEWASVRGFE
jgi:hypothetical protein